MPRPDPALRCRLAHQRVHRTTYPRGVGRDVGVQPHLADPQLGDRRRKVDIVDQHVHPGSAQTEHLTDLGGGDHQRLRHVRRIRPCRDQSSARRATNPAQPPRTSPRCGFLADQLTAHLAGRSARELVFTSTRGEVLRNRNARREWFDKAATAISEPGLTPHALRHTAASLAVSAGANVKAVQRMLGHASAAMTLDVYSDLFDDDLDAVAERLDVVARRVRVYPVCTDAQIVDLDSVREVARGQ